jgi:hypothetical protein
MDTKENDRFLSLDRWVELFKKYSLFGSLFMGTGLAALYFFGIAIHSTYTTVFGVPPFDFSLQKCLEFGGSSFVQLLTTLPVLVFIGIGDNLKEATGGQYVILILPFVLLLVLHCLKRRSSPWSVRVQKWTHWTLLFFLGFILVLFYATFLSTYQTQNVLVNPAINTLIAHRQELLENLDLRKVGLPQMDFWTANLAIHDQNWVLGKIGAMYSMAGLFLLYGILAIRSSARYYAVLVPAESGRPKWFGYLRRGFGVVFGIYLIGAAFVVPARTITLSSLTRAKVDVVIKGLESVTSRYYLILVGDYSDRYAFYLPNQQDVIIVQKSNVDAVRLLEPVSIFADRRLFVKGGAIKPGDPGRRLAP